MRWLRRCRAVRAREVGDLLCEARLAVIRNLEPIERSLESAVFRVRTAERARALGSSPHRGLPHFKTRLENDPALWERAILVWARSMRLAAPIYAFDRRLGSAPEWARAEGF